MSLTSYNADRQQRLVLFFVIFGAGFPSRRLFISRDADACSSGKH